MTRKEAIQTIEDLYPADSDYTETRALGQELLDQAKQDVGIWRNEPDAVLIRYAQLCLWKEQHPIRRNHNE